MTDLSEQQHLAPQAQTIVLRREHVKQLLRPLHLWVLLTVVIAYSVLFGCATESWRRNYQNIER